jgi:hypothetical protein
MSYTSSMPLSRRCRQHDTDAVEDVLQVEGRMFQHQLAGFTREKSSTSFTRLSSDCVANWILCG